MLRLKESAPTFLPVLHTAENASRIKNRLMLQLIQRKLYLLNIFSCIPVTSAIEVCITSLTHEMGKSRLLKQGKISNEGTSSADHKKL